MNECPKNNCGKNFKKALKKIEDDSKLRPPYIVGPTGPQGPTGPSGAGTITVGTTTTGNPGEEASVTNSGTSQNVILDFVIPAGPTGPSPISKSAYLVTFNDGTSKDGIIVPTNKALPINYKELDLTNLITLDTTNNTIKFNSAGYYKLTFIVSAYVKKDTTFNPNTDFVSIGFRKLDTDNIYIGASSWINDDTAKQITASGIMAIENPNNIYELVNLGQKDICLFTPDLLNIKSSSYFTNSLVTVIVEYLGR